MSRAWTGLLLSLVVVFLYSAAFFIASKFGVSNTDLLKNLTTSVPSALSVIVAIISIILLRPRQVIDVYAVATGSEWRSRVRITIVNLCAQPLHDITIEALFSPSRIIQPPPEAIESLAKATTVVELGTEMSPPSVEEQLPYVTPRFLMLNLRYRDSARSKMKERRIRVRNPLYIRFASIKYYKRRLIK